MSEILSPSLRFAMISVGIALIVIGAALAAWAFFTSPFSKAASVSDSFVNTLNVITYLVVKLGFLSVVVWAGSVLLSRAAQIEKAERE